MQSRRYLIYDVFTQERLTGNQLAIVLDCEGLDGTAMQKIAREFNFSESVFVLPPEDPAHRARIRIFTPEYEMPFAGHPTVGTAIALAQEDAGGGDIFVLEENIGPVRCAISGGRDAPFAEFELARLPQRLDLVANAEAIGAALGLDPDDIGFEDHIVSFWSAGVPYVTVPVKSREAAAKVRLDNEAWQQLAPKKGDWAFASPYVYCRETVNPDCAFHVRMIVPGNPSYEDPATGSAAAAFAGAILAFEKPGEGVSRFWLEQGLEMGRPSHIRLEMVVGQGRLAAARIGGQAVRVAEGILFA